VSLATTEYDAVVVGAGFAGAAAATVLAERGARVLVLETRQRPGGRAYSWVDPKTGEIRDNGQHVMGAFYHETLGFLRRIGAEAALEVEPTFDLHFWERGRGAFELRCPVLPAPLHWLAALAGCSRLGARARAAALRLPGRARALLARNGAAASATVEGWLRESAGGEDLSVILRPLALASLNERPSEGSAALFARVLERIFSSPARATGLALPRRGLSDLLDGFETYVTSRGGEVRYRATALGVRVERGAVTGLSMLGEPPVPCERLVLAVPHERAGWMLAPQHWSEYAEIARTPWSPILSTVHVFDRPVLPARFVGLLGTKTQWAFDRGAGGSGHAVGTVRSAAFEDVERPSEEIASETAADLAEAFPDAREARLLGAHVFKERRATMRALPGIDARRPPQETGVRGLALAGDWTRTGLPPTIEGAVLSGHRAAALLR